MFTKNICIERDFGTDQINLKIAFNLLWVIFVPTVGRFVRLQLLYICIF